MKKIKKYIWGNLQESGGPWGGLGSGKCGMKSLKWWKIIVAEWLSPRVTVQGNLGPLPRWSALQTYPPPPDLAYPRGFWVPRRTNFFPIYTIVTQGVAKTGEIILTWIQVWVLSLPPYVTFHKSLPYLKSVKFFCNCILILEGFCGILKEVVDVNELLHLKRFHRSVEDLFSQSKCKSLQSWERDWSFLVFQSPSPGLCTQQPSK